MWQLLPKILLNVILRLKNREQSIFDVLTISILFGPNHISLIYLVPAILLTISILRGVLA
jgi:hypothetical protein